MSQAGPQSDPQQAPAREDLRRRIEARIHHLERASGNGLWSMVLFLSVSFVAFDGFSIFPALSDGARRMLGTPPSGEMISLKLIFGISFKSPQETSFNIFEIN